jgi:hypothetical protein
MFPRVPPGQWPGEPLDPLICILCALAYSREVDKKQTAARVWRGNACTVEKTNSHNMNSIDRCLTHSHLSPIRGGLA